MTAWVAISTATTMERFSVDFLVAVIEQKLFRILLQ